ncbi:MAG: hypothetical protein L6R35_007491, partial [Caloplaca aegaea]
NNVIVLCWPQQRNALQHFVDSPCDNTPSGFLYLSYSISIASELYLNSTIYVAGTNQQTTRTSVHLLINPEKTRAEATTAGNSANHHVIRSPCRDSLRVLLHPILRPQAYLILLFLFLFFLFLFFLFLLLLLLLSLPDDFHNHSLRPYLHRGGLTNPQQAAFPTDLPVQVGSGPVCIVFCGWARLQNEDLERRPMRPLRPIMSEGMMTTSTMMSVYKSTITGQVANPMSMTQSIPLAMSSAATPSPSTQQQQHKPQSHPTTHIIAFVFSGLLGLALLLAIAWLVTRHIRKIKARLNPHTMGVHRDRARELYEQDGGKGIPEMGARGV